MTLNDAVRHTHLVLSDEADAAQLSAEMDRARRHFDLAEFAEARVIAQTVRESVLAAVGRLPRPPPGRAAIIIVTYRDEPDLGECLRLIDEQLAPDMQGILVNNGNPRATSYLGTLKGNWTAIDLGFNFGASGGRNVGAALASGEVLVFIDDDGLVEPGAIETLIVTCVGMNAAAVRGRVVAKTPGTPPSSTYDLGSARRPSIMSAEGICCVRREVFHQAGGFDELLLGHEGLLLSAGVYRLAGPYSLIYEPGAVLRHDFAPNADAAGTKQRRHQANRAYAEWADPIAGTLHATMSGMVAHSRSALPLLHYRKVCGPVPAGRYLRARAYFRRDDSLRCRGAYWRVRPVAPPADPSKL